MVQRELIESVERGFNGQTILLELMQIANVKNEDGMPVIEYVEKPNGGSVAYVRHDVLVKKLNTLISEFKQHVQF